jgi:hypothetical protein
MGVLYEGNRGRETGEWRFGEKVGFYLMAR